MGNHTSSLKAGLQDDYDAALARRGAVGTAGEAAGPATKQHDSPPPHAPRRPPPPGLALSEVASLRASRRAWDVGPLTLPLAMALDR